MRIAINARSILLANRTGIGRYTYNLIDNLGHIDCNNQYWVYVQKKFWDTKRSLPKFSHSNFKTKFDFFGTGPNFLKRIDIYHSPSPDALKIEGPKIVVTVHDLIHKAYPESHTPETIALTEQHMKEIARKADRIICTSESTRADLHRFFNFPKERSSVVYNGVDHKQFYPLNAEEKIEAKRTLAQMGITDPFILFVGTIEPRKNLAGLLQAFAQLQAQKKFTGKLVVVGMKGWMTQSIEETTVRLGIKDKVMFAGFVSDDQLRMLYNSAEVFVFPSFYEGFGFPIVEAFCCGAAVVTSSTSSCGEIAADAALKVNPQNNAELIQAIAQVLGDPKLSQSLREKALRRAQDFSFTKTTKETLKVYESLNT